MRRACSKSSSEANWARLWGEAGAADVGQFVH